MAARKMNSAPRDPAATVIITTYNRRDLIQVAIASVLEQSFTDFELLVVDDGSTDDTAAVVGQIGDPRIRYIHQENAGLAAARNTGLRLARGEYIAFLDDDDAYLPDKLRVQVAAMRDHPEVGLVSGGWIYVDEQGACLSENRPWQWRPRLDLDTWLVACPVITCSVLVKRAWLNRIGGFDESISRARLGAEDWDAWLRLAHAGCPMMWVQSLVCAYRVQEGTMSRDAWRHRQGMLRVLEKFFADPDLPPALQAQKNAVLARTHLRGAARLYAAGLTAEASEDVAAALRLDPALLAHDGEELFQALLAWTGDPIVADPIQYVTTFMTHLPPEAGDMASRKREALGGAAQRAFFAAHAKRDRRGVAASLARMAAYQPRLLFDRGVASVVFQLLLGRSLASRLRNREPGKLPTCLTFP